MILASEGASGFFGSRAIRIPCLFCQHSLASIAPDSDDNSAIPLAALCSRLPKAN